jgi:cyclic beta-1,2-glucan synthetase
LQQDLAQTVLRSVAGAIDRWEPRPGIRFRHWLGRVAKNAILLLDAARVLEAEGMDREEALMAAGRKRLRPILMTTFALVAGMVPLAQARGEHARAQTWATAALGWQAELDGPAWDGDWYMRAFFDDGSPLGSHTQAEARIDLIAQAWAVLSGEATPERQRQALHAVDTELVDDEQGLVRLLTPPLVDASPSAGYIQAYPPGVRENGGQYTHAGAWALMAAAVVALREPDAPHAHNTPYRLFTYLSPAHRAAHPQWGRAYGLEPYAVAADVYSQPPYTGRGGWSWYTGAAGWLHRGAVESILGLHLQADELWFTPCLPLHWTRAEITLVRDGRRLRCVLLRSDGATAPAARAEPNERLLRVGERLRWLDLPPDSTVLVAMD